MMLNIKFGLSSICREELKKEQLITSFYTERELIGNYLIITFKAESEKPEELINKLKKELSNINVSEEDINRLKKVWISSEVIMIDNINMTLENTVSDILEYGKIISDRIDIFRSLNKEEYNNMLKNIDFTNTSTVIIRPKKIV